jgi:hypothetical protein
VGTAYPTFELVPKVIGLAALAAAFFGKDLTDSLAVLGAAGTVDREDREYVAPRAGDLKVAVAAEVGREAELTDGADVRSESGIVERKTVVGLALGRH